MQARGDGHSLRFVSYEVHNFICGKIHNKRIVRCPDSIAIDILFNFFNFHVG